MKIKGITIDLGVNTKPVTEGFQQINKELNTTEKTLRDINKGLKLDPSNAELLGQKEKYLSKAIEETNKKLEEENKILKELEGLDGGSGKYAQQMDALKREIVDTTNKQKTYQNELDSLGKETEEAATATKSLEDSMLGANLKAQLITKGVQLAGQAFSELVGFIKETITASSDYADEINTLAKQYNLSTDQLQQFMAASELIDVDLNTITKSMSKLTKSMSSGSSSVTEAFKKLGVVTTETDGSLRDSNTVFFEVIDALGQITNETEQDALALEIFGRSAADLGPLINGGAEQLNDFNKYLEENHLLLSGDELNTLNNVQDAFDTLNGTIALVKNQLGLALAPIVQPLTDTLLEAVLNNKDALIEMVNNIVTWLTSPETMAFFAEVKGFADTLVDIIADVTQIINDLGLLDAALGIVKGTLAAIKAVLDLIKGVAERVREFIAEINSGYDPSKWNMATQGYGAYGNIGGGASGGFSSGGLTVNSTITVNNNGTAITSSQVRSWADMITERVNENLGRMV